MTQGADPDAAVKSCCAVAYQHDAVALVLGDSYHPGGMALTRRLAETVGLRSGERVLDVAAGPGTTAMLLAADHDVRVDGVDLAEGSVRAAGAAARRAGLDDRVSFRHGDAERLPFDDATFDAVVCECALCTFPDKHAAAAEFARVLRPGGRVGITDVTVAPGGLDDGLAGLAGRVACLADARTAEEYAAVLGSAGLSTTLREDHDEALTHMVGRIDARLRTLRMLPERPAALADVDLDQAIELTARAGRAVRSGSAGYTLLVAAKPAAPTASSLASTEKETTTR